MSACCSCNLCCCLNGCVAAATISLASCGFATRLRNRRPSATQRDDRLGRLVIATAAAHQREPSGRRGCSASSASSRSREPATFWSAMICSASACGQAQWFNARQARHGQSIERAALRTIMFVRSAALACSWAAASMGRMSSGRLKRSQKSSREHPAIVLSTAAAISACSCLARLGSSILQEGFKRWVPNREREFAQRV